MRAALARTPPGPCLPRWLAAARHRPPGLLAAYKILCFHEAFGHDLQSFSLSTMLPHEQQLEMLERLATEVIPVVRRQAPTTLWTDQDPYGDVATWV